MQRRYFLFLGLVLLVLAVGWMSFDESQNDGSHTQVDDTQKSVGSTTTSALDRNTTTGASSSKLAKPSKDASPPTDARLKRDALRREIARQIALATRSTTPAGIPGTEHPSNEEPEHPPPKLKNKLKGREALGEFLNKEFSPFVSECVEQATTRSPKLSGMFAISINTLAAEELGAVIDSADPAAHNEIDDPLFFECIRESAFSLTIPPPIATGEEGFEVNGNFGEPPPGDAGP